MLANLVLSASTQAAAGNLPAACADKKTEVGKCLTALIDEALGDADRASVVMDASHGTAGATAGKPFSPALTTFSKIIAGGIDFVAVQSTDGAITVESPSLGFGGPVRAKAVAEVFQPSVASSVLGGISDETTKALAAAELPKELTDLDDWRLSTSVGFGADRSSLVARLLASVRRQYRNPDLLVLLQKSVPVNIDTTEDLETLGRDLGQDPVAVLRPYAEKIAAVVADDRAVTVKARDALVSLLQNDALAVIDATYRQRDALVGRNEVSLRGSLQYGFRGFRDFLGDARAASCAEGGTDDDCLKAFTAWENEKHDAILRSMRLALSVEYTSSSSYHLEIPKYNLLIDQPSAHSVVWSVKVGGNLSGGAKAPVRVDVGLSYEDNSQDATRHDRLLGSLSLAVRLSDSLQVPIGVTYANHAQYLADVDKHVGVHFGLTFRQ